jgi:hypothetical protein
MARAAATLLVYALAAPACFDVRQVDPGPVVIDDFDDGNLVPALTAFESWLPYSFNAQGSELHSDLTQGNTNSPFAVYLDFRVADPPDGEVQEAGAALMSESQVPWDVNAYRALVFAAKLESSGVPALPVGALLYVELGCKTAVAENGSRPGNLYVVASINYTSDWQEHRIEIASFGDPSWLSRRVAGGPAQCRQRIDSIRFSVDAKLNDGQSGHGVLTLDNIYVE